MTNKSKLTLENCAGHNIVIDERFNNINRWTFLGMQAFEARSFLLLSEKTYKAPENPSMDELLTQQALFRSFIISYAKCFSSAGKGRIKLEKSKVYENKDDLAIIHEKIMELRNKFAAHSDTSELEEGVIDTQEYEDHYRIRNLYTLALPTNEYDNYRKAITTLDEYIIIGVNKALDSLERQLGKKILNQSSDL